MSGSRRPVYRLQTLLGSQFQTTPAVGTELRACERWSQSMEIAKSIDSTLAEALRSLISWASPTLTTLEMLRAVKAWLELPHAVSAVEADRAARMLLGERYAGRRQTSHPHWQH